MKRKEQWNRSAWPRVLAAVLINAAFLLLMLTAFAPVYETNDDLLMSKFVDGQLSVKTAYVPYVNILLGWLLKMLYTLFGDGFNWYAACQYFLLFLGFTAITWTLLRRFAPLPALVMTVVILGAFASDCYLSMNFSKPAAVGTVGGMSLMLHAMRNDSGKVSRTPLVLGILLALGGFCWRWEEFGVCAVLMAAVCLSALFEIFGENRHKPRGQRRSASRYLAPFVLLAALAVGLYALFQYAWNRPEVRFYKHFDDSRSLLIDYEIPDYKLMPEVYDELDMDENFVYMMKNWSFYDTEVFTQEAIDTMLAARTEHVHRRTFGECLGVFLNKCLMGFTQDRPFAGFALFLALWLACGRRRRAGDWAVVIYMAGMFFVMYMAFIYLERYLANRVDIGLFLAMAMVLSFHLEPEKLSGEKLLLTAVLLLSLLISYRANRVVCLYDSHNTIEDKSFEKAAVARLLEDTEHLYFVKVWSVDHQLYTPLEPAPAGYADRLVHIGGWSMHHPVIEALLQSWGIENPYRDLVNNDSVYLIDNDIDRTLAYLRFAYYPDAAAELLQPLSDETGYRIYRITG
ncbi:MAG: hypothetical protein IJV41_09280 [Oscillospiraceae bacterium]|nr:hypothetical protein [Oscillospiraceae bacterium]